YISSSFCSSHILVCCSCPTRCSSDLLWLGIGIRQLQSESGRGGTAVALHARFVWLMGRTFPYPDELVCQAALPAPNESAIPGRGDRKSTRLNSSHQIISYVYFCLNKQ